MTSTEILAFIREKYTEILAEKLVGIYVHGSLAFGCFEWSRSDIDFLAVVRERPAQGEKEALIAALLALDPHCPPKGLEMSVVLAGVCRPFVYPTPFELHFSNAHRERCRSDLAGYCREMNGVDRDLAAHFAVTRAVGYALCGEPVGEVFAEVPRVHYLDSIIFDIESAERDILEDPVYVTLNLCRAAAFVEENVILSKRQGGEWGLEKLPAEFAPTVSKALTHYAGGAEFSEDAALLGRFAKFMLGRVAL